MLQTAIKVYDVQLLPLETDDPREVAVAGKLLRELTRLSAKLWRLQQRSGGLIRSGCRMTAIEFHILQIHNKLNRLAKIGRMTN
jgi:hypothetical protein